MLLRGAHASCSNRTAHLSEDEGGREEERLGRPRGLHGSVRDAAGRPGGLATRVLSAEQNNTMVLMSATTQKREECKAMANNAEFTKCRHVRCMYDQVEEAE